MASMSNSGNKELSSSQVNKSTAAGKEGYMTQGGAVHDIRAPVETFTDMSMDMKVFCHKKAELAYKMNMKGELKYFKNMAEFIKNQLDEEYKGAWQVIVGREFGSYFGYEEKCCTLFWINHIGFLIFKFG